MRKRLPQILFLILILITSLVLNGCSSRTSPSTMSTQTSAATFPTVKSTSSSSNTTASTPSSTFGTMATLGLAIFKKYGAMSHGQNAQGGSGPALIGSNASLAKYGTAQGLLDYISTTMPKEAPGSLSHQDYLNVLCYLLVENNYVSANTIFDESQLNSITLK